jgi:cytochrome c peroxidase
LRQAITLFKTPGLRDLGHSAPYSHIGQADTLEDVITGYMKNSDIARNDELRNGDRRLKNISLTEEDIQPLVLFLQSLNEDYS